MIFVYSYTGDFIEMAESSSYLKTEITSDMLIINDISCQTREEFEKHYKYNTQEQRFVFTQNEEISVEDVAVIFESTKQSLCNDLDTYAHNRLVHGIDFGFCSLPATDETLSILQCMIRALEYGDNCPQYVYDVNNNIFQFSHIEEIKPIFLQLIGLRNKVLLWKNAHINAIKTLTTLASLQSYQEQMTFI